MESQNILGKKFIFEFSESVSKVLKWDSNVNKEKFEK